MDTATLLDRVAQSQQAGSYQRAIQLCNLGLNRDPTPELERTLWLARAAAHAQNAQWALTEFDCRRALERADDGQARALLARSLLQQRRHGEALQALERELARDGRCAESWQLLSRVLSGLLRHREAADAARKAWELDPTAERLVELVHELASCGRHHEAIERSQRELEQRPACTELWALLGVSLNALGCSAAAASACRRALELEPQRVDAHCALALALLRQANFREGFQHNEYRQKNAGDCRRLGVPPWAGVSQATRQLLVWCEQGIGDSLQFARFLPLARRVAQGTTFMVPKALVRLLESNPQLGPISTHHPGFGAADHQALVMSLPHRLQLGDRIDAASLPYLFAERRLAEDWRGQLPPGPKVALVWQGNPDYAGDRWRSLPFAQYEPLIARFSARVHFLSLQKNFGREQLPNSRCASQIIDLADRIDRDGHAFVDSLAILSQVDLLITTDTSIAHLAGAAGIRTWVLLGDVPDWRWGMESEHSVWYPSLRLFRQSAPGDWAGVLQRVGSALQLALPFAANEPQTPHALVQFGRCS